MSPDTVETKLKECDAEIAYLKLHGLRAAVVISILEHLVDVVRTLAVHTVQARIKKV